MFSPESKLHLPGMGNAVGKVPQPNMPGLTPMPQQSNPFQGIRRAGQAKRAQNFEKFQQGQQNKDLSFQGAKNQSFGGLAGTQSGSMRQNKFS
jgi:hypothetical protein